MTAPKTRSSDRLQNPRDELKRAVQRAERALAAASGEGFREVFPRVRRAVVDSEPLVRVLGRLVRQGRRRVRSTDLLPPDQLQDAVQPVRVAVGRLANTTPAKFSADFGEYTRRVDALIVVGKAVLDRGVEPVEPEELDEWKPFREP